MIVYDVTNPESFENVAAVWVKEVRNYASRDPKILLIGNKSDLKGKMSDAERERIDHLAREVQEQLSEGGGSGTVDVIAWVGHGQVSWTGCATAESSLPTGPDLEVYQNRGVCLAKCDI